MKRKDENSRACIVVWHADFFFFFPYLFLGDLI
jgi:hypothetical protein